MVRIMLSCKQADIISQPWLI